MACDENDELGSMTLLVNAQLITEWFSDVMTEFPNVGLQTSACFELYEVKWRFSLLSAVTAFSESHNSILKGELLILTGNTALSVLAGNVFPVPRDGENKLMNSEPCAP